MFCFDSAVVARLCNSVVVVRLCNNAVVARLSTMQWLLGFATMQWLLQQVDSVQLFSPFMNNYYCTQTHTVFSKRWWVFTKCPHLIGCCSWWALAICSVYVRVMIV